jgi:hypothetical protein
MNQSKTFGECEAKEHCISASCRTSPQTAVQASRFASLTIKRRRIFLEFAVGALAFTALLLSSCGDDPAPKPAADAAAKPAEPTVPEEMQSAAIGLLGKETQVLIFGDLAKNGKQQFLAANVVPKTPKNDLPGTIVTRAVIVENEDGKWTELFRCDEHLKNSKGYLAMTPLTSVGGWRLQYEQDPVKGLQLYVTPIIGAADPHQLPIGVAWNPATKRYQSLDRTYEHFLLETPSIENAHSVLK